MNIFANASMPSINLQRSFCPCLLSIYSQIVFSPLLSFESLYNQDPNHLSEWWFSHILACHSFSSHGLLLAGFLILYISNLLIFPFMYHTCLGICLRTFHLELILKILSYFLNFHLGIFTVFLYAYILYISQQFILS